MAPRDISRREQLLQLTERYLTFGLPALTFDRLARKVGIRKPSITYHFSSKKVLLLTVIERERSRQDELHARALATEPAAALARLTALLRTSLRAGPSPTLVPLLLAIELGEDDGELLLRCRETLHRVERSYRLLLGRAIDTGQLPAELDVADGAAWIRQIELGALALSRARGDRAPLELALRQLESWLHGMGTEDDELDDW